MKIKSISLIFLILLFSACSRQENDADLKKYVADLKKVSENPSDFSKQFNFKPAPAASISHVPNPFPQYVETKDTQHSQLPPLEQYPLDAVHLVGIVQLNVENIAVLQLPDNKIYQVAVGDRVGSERGKVSKITPAEMVVREPANPAQGRLEAHQASLYLKDQ